MEKMELSPTLTRPSVKLNQQHFAQLVNQDSGLNPELVQHDQTLIAPTVTQEVSALNALQALTFMELQETTLAIPL